MTYYGLSIGPSNLILQDASFIHNSLTTTTTGGDGRNTTVAQAPRRHPLVPSAKNLGKYTESSTKSVKSIELIDICLRSIVKGQLDRFRGLARDTVWLSMEGAGAPGQLGWLPLPLPHSG